jgi:hypothetical protein
MAHRPREGRHLVRWDIKKTAIFSNLAHTPRVYQYKDGAAARSLEPKHEITAGEPPHSLTQPRVDANCCLSMSSSLDTTDAIVIASPLRLQALDGTVSVRSVQWRSVALAELS